MKKILMVLLLFLVLSINKVQAQTDYKINIDYQPNIYYARVGGSLGYMSSQFAIYRFGDIITYCIDPAHNITTYNYIDKDNSILLDYSDEIKEKIELIGYYGREYPGHDNVRYSMAAQALIWEITSGQTVTFWTKRYEEGNKIDVSKERKEILDLISKHKEKPEFESNDLVGYINKEIVLSETTNLLEDFYISDNDENEARIEGKNIYITPKKIGVTKIVLSKKKYDEVPLLTFVGKDKTSSQVLARLRLTKDIHTEINLNIKGRKIKLNKVDEKNNSIAISGIKFKIKDIETNNYICENSDCLYVTDSMGSFITQEYYYGNYEIEEVEDQLIEGYALNKNKLNISINNETINWDDNSEIFEVSFPNKKILGKVEINKIGEEAIFQDNDITYKEVALNNISFSLYDNNDLLIDTIITDNNGHALINSLPLGKYYLIENNDDLKYIRDNQKYYFEVKQENKYESLIPISLTINNYLKKGKLDFSKEDLTTSEGIPNTIIEIYDEKDNLLLTRTTNEEGKVNIDNIPVGKYYIIEKEANENYQITNEKVFFEIKEDNEIIKAKMINEKKEVFVPQTGRSDNLIISMISFFSLLISLGLKKYEKCKVC